MKLCPKCKKLQAAEFAKRYAANVEAGKCGTCGAARVPGRKKCRFCLDRDARAQREWYQRKKAS